MNSRDQAHFEDRKALAALERRPWLIIAIAIVALVAVSALVYGIVNTHTENRLQQLTNQNRVLTQQAQQAADEARIQALAGCQLYKLIAEAPLMPTTSSLGLNIAVGARIGYATADCTLGALKPADPRVAKLLPPGVK